MGNTFTIEGAPKFTTVSTAGAFLTACANAKPGEVVTLDTIVPAFTPSTGNVKNQPGCIFQVQPGQPLDMPTIATKGINTEFLGGHYTNTSGGAASYAVRLSGGGDFSIRGATLGESATNVLGQATDFVIADVLMEWPTVDLFQLTGCQRFRVERPFGRDMFKGRQIKWFNDGRAPVDGVAFFLPQNAASGWFDDTAHNDAAQPRSSAGAGNSPPGGPSTAVPCTDFVFSYWDVHVLGAGIVAFEYPDYRGAGYPSNLRGVVEYCQLYVTDPGGISLHGSDLRIVGNTVAPHPEEGSNFGLYIAALLSTGSIPNGVPDGVRVQGGQNTILGAGAYYNQPEYVDLSSPIINGAMDVVPPEAPAFGTNRLPWAPAVVRPPYTPFTGNPEIFKRPTVYWTTAGPTPRRSTDTPQTPPTVGTYLTCGIGVVRGFANTEAEWSCRVDGAAVVCEPDTDNRVYKLVAGDMGGKPVVFSTRRRKIGSGPSGWGLWRDSLAVVTA